VAAGKSVAAWAKANNIPLRTAYEWYRRPEFTGQVEEFRRRFFDRALGQMARSVGKAVAEIVKLSTTADSESVRLQAARAVVADLMVMSDYAGLDKRIADVEKQLLERTGGAGSSD